MRSMFLALVMGLLAAGAQAQTRFQVSEAQMTRFPSCKKVSTWAVANMPEVCTSARCLTNIVGDYVEARGWACGRSESGCLVPAESQAEGVWPSHQVIYLQPYPGFYSSFAEGRIDGARWQAAKQLGPDNAFVAAEQVIGGENFAAVEEAYNARGGEFVFVDMNVRLADGQVETGRAICRRSESSAGAAVPRDCVMTRIRKEDGDYLLATLGEAGGGLTCPASADFINTTGYVFGTDMSDRQFAGVIVDRLVAEGVQIDTTTMRNIFGEEEFTIQASAGPRVSVVDRRIRERVDLSIFARSQSNPSIWQDDQRVEVPGRSFRFETRLSAWTGRQQDAEGVWAWPSDTYYAAMNKLLNDGIETAFSETCASLGLTIEQVGGFGFNGKICR